MDRIDEIIATILQATFIYIMFIMGGIIQDKDIKHPYLFSFISFLIYRFALW